MLYLVRVKRDDYCRQEVFQVWMSANFLLQKLDFSKIMECLYIRMGFEAVWTFRR